MQKNTLLEYQDYFRNLSNLHKDLNDFVLMDVHELDKHITNKLQFNAMGLEDPVWLSGGDGFANVRMNFLGAFMIFKRVKDLHDKALNPAKNECARICEELAARMINDRKTYQGADADYLLNGLDHSSFSIEIMPNLLHGCIAGARLSFKINRPMLLYFECEDQFIIPD